MAHKKGMGSSKNGRDSNPKMLGVKRADGQFVTTGIILVKTKMVQKFILEVMLVREVEMIHYLL